MARILVVDDASFMRAMLRDVLTKEGHTVFEACNGQEMLDMYDKNNPDLVTMDITMPVMNGIDGVKALMNRHSDAKIIMCSALGQKVMILDAIKSGAKDFIVKPFDPERIVDAVNRTLQHK